MKYICHNLEETKKVAQIFLKKLIPVKGRATIVALNGNLGSAKTTFTQLLAKELGIKGNLTSPTFVIEKKYPILDHKNFKKLIHIDAYRLKGGRDLLTLDWTEISQDSSNLILIEWPELVADILPADSLKVNFEFVDENTRKISF